MSEFKEYWDKLRRIVKSHPKGRAYDENGQFYPDPTPVAPPVGFDPSEIDMFERVRSMVRREMSHAAQAEGFETFEEADDFDVDDEVEPFSEYELIVEQAYPDAPIRQPDPDQVKGASPPSDGPGQATPPAPAPEAPEGRKAP